MWLVTKLCGGQPKRGKEDRMKLLTPTDLLVLDKIPHQRVVKGMTFGATIAIPGAEIMTTLEETTSAEATMGLVSSALSGSG